MKTVLLVEDDDDHATLFRLAWTKAGLGQAPKVMTDGDAAIAYLEGRAPFDDRSAHPLPSLVVLDLKLPRRSGLDVLAWMRSRPSLSNVPAVILSSSQEPSDLARAEALGCRAFYTKPGGFSPFVDLVRRIHAHGL